MLGTLLMKPTLPPTWPLVARPTRSSRGKKRLWLKATAAWA